MDYKTHSASQDEATLALLIASPTALQLPKPETPRHWLGEKSFLQCSATQLESPNMEIPDQTLGLFPASMIYLLLGFLTVAKLPPKPIYLFPG